MNYIKITLKSDMSFYRLESTKGISELFQKILPRDINLESVTRRLRQYKNTGEFIIAGSESYKRDDFHTEEDVELGYFTQYGEKILIEETYKEPFFDSEYEKLYDKYEKALRTIQRLRDDNTIHRAKDRKEHRLANQSEIFLEEISSYIEKYPKLPRIKKKVNNSKLIAVLQFSDSHFGCKIDLPHNEVDSFVVRDRVFRIKDKFVQRCKKLDINKIVIAMTGDMIHLSNKRDMLLARDMTRAEALMVAYDTYSQVIRELLEDGYDVSMCGVVGNESRLFGLDTHTNLEDECRNNFDYILYQMLKRTYPDSVGFLNDGDKLEDVVNINGQWLALCHGDKFKHGNLRQEVMKFVERMRTQFGVEVAMTIFGHIHEMLLSHLFSRSSSLIGGNEYSERALNIPNSDISQLMHIFSENEIITSRIGLE